MPGEDERATEKRCEAATHVAGIRVVRVNDVGEAMVLAEQGKRVVDKSIEVAPQRFLSQVASRAGMDSPDEGIVSERFAGIRIIRADPGIADQPGEEVDLADIFMLGECFDQLDDVFALTTRVGIAAQFQVFPTDQSVDGDMDEIEIGG